MSQSNKETDKNSSIFSFLRFSGYRYWTFSLLPALVGTTLPFWLDPPGFSFQWFAAVEFFIAILLLHSSFSFFHAYFKDRATAKWTKPQLLWSGIIFLLVAVLIGFHLNTNLQLNTNVHESIFIVYFSLLIFIGVLYVIPPFSFFKRVGGEIIFCVGLGMMPILGAYLIQAGDLHRTVYLASLPFVVSTGLWLWVSELMNRTSDENKNQTSMVMLFSPKFSARFGTLILGILIYMTILVAVFARSSLNPLSLVALISFPFALKIIIVAWNEYSNISKRREILKYAIIIHYTISMIIIASSILVFLV